MQSNNNFEWKSTNQLTPWAADVIVPPGMHILCIAMRYNKPKKPEILKMFNLLRFFNETT